MFSRIRNIVRNHQEPKSPAGITTTFYDIIGDVHGQARELTSLLKKMGYTQTQGTWSHSYRKAVFAGDFISRGPDSRKVISMVREMVQNGTGLAILGNHELNAIAHFTRSDGGASFREATGTNKKMMDRLKSEYADDPLLLKEHLKWLRKLPFFLDLGSIRIVHAYWAAENLTLITEKMTKGKLTKSLLKELYSEKTPLGEAIRQTTRGIELRLPKDFIIKDSKNIRRTNFRIRWWEDPKGKTFKQISYGNKFILPAYTVPPELLFPFKIYGSDEPLVFVGHYCIDTGPLIPTTNVCCVDNCIANGGRLAAYRWSGESTAEEANFIFQKKL